jgi:hypothetical protein
MIEGPIAWSILSAVFTGGIAFGGFKVALNGTKDRIDKLEEQEQDTQEHRVEVAERLASLETKIDIILEKVN